MPRQIKFRVWSQRIGMDYDPSVGCAGGEDYQINYAFTTKQGTDDRVWMQFTGLLDKNGKEIYEGDILAYCNDKSPRHGKIKGHIVFDNACFRLKRFREEESHLDTISVPSYMRTHEVVGDIYSNPELLTNNK